MEFHDSLGDASCFGRHWGLGLGLRDSELRNSEIFWVQVFKTWCRPMPSSPNGSTAGIVTQANACHFNYE